MTPPPPCGCVFERKSRTVVLCKLHAEVNRLRAKDEREAERAYALELFWRNVVRPLLLVLAIAAFLWSVFQLFAHHPNERHTMGSWHALQSGSTTAT